MHFVTKLFISRSNIGSLLVMLSAILYGIMPAMAKGIYADGCNSLTLTLLRSLLPLPALFVLARREQPNLRLPKGSFLFVIVSACFHSFTTLLLYSSYNHIPTGMATTLHYVYPLVVAFLSALFLHLKLDVWKKIGLFLGMLGVSFFALGNISSNLYGIVHALLSGCTFGSYMVMLGTRRIKQIPCHVYNWYLALVTIILAGSLGLATHQLTLELPAGAWMRALIFSLLLTIGANILLQLGIRMTTPSNAALLSLLEPITSVIIGLLFLGDAFSATKAAGCIIILISLLLTTVGEKLIKPRN
jgi:drug/metabolite transporter (DMT)-like permease